jgi:DNA-binding MarR family transcriptional regulator
LVSSFQKRVKADHRRNILRIIETKQPTFKELQKEVKLTPPTLSKHLSELVHEGLIAREYRGPKQVVILLTNKGKSEEQKRRESIPLALGIFKLLVHEPWATKTLSDLSEWAEENPGLVESFMKEFGQIITNDDVLRWIAKHPGREGADVLKRELLKRMGKPEQVAGLEQEERMKITFHLLSEAFRDITASKESKKAQDH